MIQTSLQKEIQRLEELVTFQKTTICELTSIKENYQEFQENLQNDLDEKIKVIFQNLGLNDLPAEEVPSYLRKTDSQFPDVLIEMCTYVSVYPCLLNYAIEEDDEIIETLKSKITQVDVSKAQMHTTIDKLQSLLLFSEEIINTGTSERAEDQLEQLENILLNQKLELEQKVIKQNKTIERLQEIENNFTELKELLDGHSDKACKRINFSILKEATAPILEFLSIPESEGVFNLVNRIELLDQEQDERYQKQMFAIGNALDLFHIWDILVTHHMNHKIEDLDKEFIQKTNDAEIVAMQLKINDLTCQLLDSNFFSNHSATSNEDF